jgi:hypothetical protein
MLKHPARVAMMAFWGQSIAVGFSPQWRTPY